MARWTIRIATCLTLAALSACATAVEPARTPRPNEVQVFEPAGQPDRWTYTPNTLSVAAGTTVTFVNHGTEFHTVTSDDPGRLFDISLDTNKTATFTFAKAGTFTYHCGVHPQMKGVIRVW
jgi:plastocyanin